MGNIYDNINDYNPMRNCKMFIIFDDTIADMNTNKTFYSAVKELLDAEN